MLGTLDFLYQSVTCDPVSTTGRLQGSLAGEPSSLPSTIDYGWTCLPGRTESHSEAFTSETHCKNCRNCLTSAHDPTLWHPRWLPSAQQTVTTALTPSHLISNPYFPWRILVLKVKTRPFLTCQCLISILCLQNGPPTPQPCTDLPLEL